MWVKLLLESARGQARALRLPALWDATAVSQDFGWPGGCGARWARVMRRTLFGRRLRAAVRVRLALRAGRARNPRRPKGRAGGRQSRPHRGGVREQRTAPRKRCPRRRRNHPLYRPAATRPLSAAPARLRQFSQRPGIAAVDCHPERAADAHARMESNANAGKLVLTVGDPAAS